jgi:signal transduction histidine kinase
MVIVVPDDAWQSTVAVLLSEHRTLRDLHFEHANGTPQQALARVRRVHGGAPVAYVAGSELEALDAIEAGADEALCLSRAEASQALVLIERAARRAAQRLAVEQSRGLAARAEKLAALETVVAAVAHEINNPLAAVSLSVEYLRGKLLPSLPRDLFAESRRVFDDVLDMVDAIAAIVRDLRSYARADQDDALEWVEIPELIEQALRTMGSELSAIALVERDYAPDLPRVCVPRSRIAQVITNIFVNAGHAMRDVERALHRVRITVRADDEALAISISDTGSGIDPAALERIFEPYFTTKRDGRGTGLGLAISRSILQRIGGDLMVASVHGEGATFILLIPRATRGAGSERPLPRHAPTRARGRPPTLLVVEDDPRLLGVYPRLLREQFNVLTAAEGQEAIELLRSGVHIDAIVSDVNMPAVDGEQLYAWVKEHHPALAARMLFVTGALDPRRAPFFASMGKLILEKPVSSEQLIAAVHALLPGELGRAAE